MKRTALVTGGNRGIGLAIAKGLVQLGLDVIVGSRDLKNGEQAACGIGAQAVRLDLTSTASIRQAVEQTGPVDVLVNNAGVLFERKMLDNPKDFADSMSV